MAGNNLFGGLNSGDSSKYKKAGEQAAKRERAEQLDARIDKFLAKKQDIEWAVKYHRLSRWLDYALQAHSTGGATRT